MRFSMNRVLCVLIVALMSVSYSVNSADSVNLALLNSPKADTKRSTFLDVALPIPGKVEAEYFDHGGEGVAYHNVTHLKSRKQRKHCQRPNDAIELEVYDERCVVSRSAYKEWMSYTVNVLQNGIYDINVHYSNAGPKGSMFIAKGNPKNILQEQDLPSTGKEKNFEVMNFKNVPLTKGEYPIIFGFSASNQPMYNDRNTALVMQLVGATSHAQLDFVEFIPADHNKNQAWVVTPLDKPEFSIPGILQAGRYDQKQTQKSYRDHTAKNVAFSGNNEFPCGKLTSVDVEIRGDVCVLTHTEAGEWLSYSFKAEREGFYDVLLSTFSSNEGGKFYLQLNNRGVTQPLSVKKSVSPYTPEVLMAKKIFVPKGTHTLKIVMLEGGSDGFVGSFAHIEILDHFDRFDVTQNVNRK